MGLEVLSFELLSILSWVPILHPWYQNSDGYVAGIVRRCLDSYMCSYDKVLVIGDFNSEISEMAMSEFCET